MPGVVKGSRQQRMIVVPWRPWRARFLQGLLLSAFLLTGVGAYLAGQHELLPATISDKLRFGLLPPAPESVRASVSEAPDEETIALRRQVAMLERTSQMDRRANEEIRDTVRSLRETIDRLEQDIVFYRQAMSPENENGSSGPGLNISALAIDALPQPRRFHYKVVLRKREGNEQMLKGYANVSIIGKQTGKQHEEANERKVLSLSEVSERHPEPDIALGFRYFQNLEGELVLPEGFVPEQLEIVAVATEPEEQKISQRFSWVATQPRLETSRLEL